MCDVFLLGKLKLGFQVFYWRLVTCTGAFVIDYSCYNFRPQRKAGVLHTLHCLYRLSRQVGTVWFKAPSIKHPYQLVHKDTLTPQRLGSGQGPMTQACPSENVHDLSSSVLLSYFFPAHLSLPSLVRNRSDMEKLCWA